MIRSATLADLPALMAMAGQFAAVAELNKIAAYDASSMERTFRFLIENDDGILLIAVEGGAAGGLIHPPYWNLSERIGQEMFWWVNPECRGSVGLKLLDALEAAAKAKGATAWSMIALQSSAPERTGKLYERRGYRPTEHSYVRSL